VVEIGYCTRCSTQPPEENQILQELSYAKNRSLKDISRQINRYKSMKEKATQNLAGRQKEKESKLAEYEQELKQYEEELSYEAMERLMHGEEVGAIAENIMSDEMRLKLEQVINSLKYQPKEVSYKDVEDALKEYEQRGYIDIEGERVRITSRGARVLAKMALQRAMENLIKKEIGPHPIKESGYGSQIGTNSRRYEVGDEYELVDIEKTLLNSLERNGRVNLELKDFQVFETVHQTRICAGLLIDESGSMQSDHKIKAAVEAALALSELMIREPKDKVLVFLFSEKVKQIPPWDIVNSMIGGGSTDIRAAMRAFRKAAGHERGDKQAYLITDTEPNAEDGMYVGFDRAMEGVLQEALRYRENGITLNIIMLDQRPQLREFARILARKNLGRVMFTNAQNLGGVIIEDYLRTKKEKSFV